MSIEVTFQEAHSMQIHRWLNSLTGYIGAKVKLLHLQIRKKNNYLFYRGQSL